MVTKEPSDLKRSIDAIKRSATQFDQILNRDFTEMCEKSSATSPLHESEPRSCPGQRERTVARAAAPSVRAARTAGLVARFLGDLLGANLLFSAPLASATWPACREDSQTHGRRKGEA